MRRKTATTKRTKRVGPGHNSRRRCARVRKHDLRPIITRTCTRTRPTKCTITCMKIWSIVVNLVISYLVLLNGPTAHRSHCSYKPAPASSHQPASRVSRNKSATRFQRTFAVRGEQTVNITSQPRDVFTAVKIQRCAVENETHLQVFLQYINHTAACCSEHQEWRKRAAQRRRHSNLKLLWRNSGERFTQNDTPFA